MAVVNVKEIYKKLNHGLREIRDAVKMAKQNLIIGEVNFPGAEKKARIKKAKVTPETEGNNEP